MRPLHSIVCTFDGEVVPFEIEGIRSGNVTRGHRFMGAQHIEVRRFEDYEQKLRAAHVILDGAEARQQLLAFNTDSATTTAEIPNAKFVIENTDVARVDEAGRLTVPVPPVQILV